MSNNVENPLDAKDSDAALAYAEERRENIKDFVRTNPDYYIAQFDHIGENANFTPTLNIMAGLFGPIWFGARGFRFASFRGELAFLFLLAARFFFFHPWFL